MEKRTNHTFAAWRKRIVMLAILWLAPTMLVACALQDPLAEVTLLQETGLAEVPVSASLEAVTPSEYAFFGGAVAISGNTAVIGAWGEADRGRNTGAAYVFDRNGDAWTQRARLTAADAMAGARFGHSVAIDNDVILVGAMYHGGDGPRMGAVYVFELGSEMWRQTAQLRASDATADAYFGSSLALDGRTALIGASGPTAGAAYVFHAENTEWTQQARLAPDLPREGHRFGISVALEGATAVVGSPSRDGAHDAENTDVPDSSTHVFERTQGIWEERAVLTPGRVGFEGAFGHALALGNGVLVVGAPGEAESVFVYRRSDGEWRLWSELAGIAGATQHFGTAVAVDDDMLVVGAPGGNERAGAAYIFEVDGSTWVNTAWIVADTSSPNLHLGGSVAADGGIALLGATGGRSAGVASGSAFAVH